jgi:hypothetical protein
MGQIVIPAMGSHQSTTLMGSLEPGPALFLVAAMERLPCVYIQPNSTWRDLAEDFGFPPLPLK